MFVNSVNANVATAKTHFNATVSFLPSKLQTITYSKLTIIIFMSPCNLPRRITSRETAHEPSRSLPVFLVRKFTTFIKAHYALFFGLWFLKSDLSFRIGKLSAPWTWSEDECKCNCALRTCATNEILDREVCKCVNSSTESFFLRGSAAASKS